MSRTELSIYMVNILAIVILVLWIITVVRICSLLHLSQVSHLNMPAHVKAIKARHIFLDFDWAHEYTY